MLSPETGRTGRSPKTVLETSKNQDYSIETFINTLPERTTVRCMSIRGGRGKMWIGDKALSVNGEPKSLLEVWGKINEGFLIRHKATGFFESSQKGHTKRLLIREGKVVYRENPGGNNGGNNDFSQFNFLDLMDA